MESIALSSTRPSIPRQQSRRPARQPSENPLVAVFKGVGIGFFRLGGVFYAYASQYVADGVENLVAHNLVIVRAAVESFAVYHRIACREHKCYHPERLSDVLLYKVEEAVFLCDGEQVVTAAYDYLYAVLENVERKCLLFISLFF